MFTQMVLNAGNLNSTAACCANCGRPLADDRYCGDCGQRVIDHRRPLRHLLGEFQDQVFAFDGRSWRTLVMLIRRPGLLTAVYNAGRRVLFVPPLRLYLLISFFFFLAIQLTDQQIVQFSSTVALEDAAEDATAVAVEPGDPALPQVSSARPAEPATETEDESPFSRFISTRLEHVEQSYDDPQAEINELVSRRVPQTMFFLVPMMALILKLVYFRRGVFYVEHLIFAVHAHAAIFLALLVAILLNVALAPWWEQSRLVGLPIILAMTVHFFKSLRRVYQQSRLISALKWIVIGIAYGLSFSVAFLGVLLISLLLV